MGRRGAGRLWADAVVGKDVALDNKDQVRATVVVSLKLRMVLSSVPWKSKLSI